MEYLLEMVCEKIRMGKLVLGNYHSVKYNSVVALFHRMI